MDELLERWRDGTATEADLRELTARLATPEHRDALLEDWLVESALPRALPAALVADQRESALTSGTKPSPRAEPKRWGGWLQWRPLAAAAAGIVFGILCTSVVFAYVVPSLGKVITLLQESFESGPSPLVTGVPVKAGVWSGDFTEVVGEQQAVKPEAGTKMLRFLRADYEGKANRDSGSVADVYRLIDLRAYREQFADGAAVVQFSAGFNAAAFPEGDVYMCKMSLHAYDAQTVAGGPLR
ncbi:MAG: hypothetical protein ABIP85_17755, partial [Chthoniobacteraceae bacterium]